MPRFFRSYGFFFLATSVFPVVSAVGGLSAWESPFRMNVWIPAAVAAAWAVCALLCRLTRSPLLPKVSVLWLLLLWAVACSAACNLYAFAAPWQMPVSVFLAMGCACLLWAALRWWGLLFWVPFLFLEAAQVAGYTQYGARINSLVLAETFEASAEEALAYLSPGNMLIAAAGLLGAFLFGYLSGRILRRERCRLTLCHTGLMFGLFGYLSGVTPPPHQQKDDYFWPVYETYELYTACAEALNSNQATIEQAESLPSPKLRPSTISTLRGGEGVVLVVHIGESVRADRMSLNGYERDTTPWLRRQERLINFPDCISAACDTCQAQLAILTDARRDVRETDPALRPTTGSVLDLFDANGFRVYSFFGRRAGQQLKYDRVIRVLTRCSAERFNAPGSPWTSVPQMAEVADANRCNNILLFINNEGSHTPFYHYDRENPPFSPAGSDFQSPAKHAEEVNNAYDNTVHYTDEYVRRVVRLLRGRPFVYLYISDHGEYLGHEGIWGRGGLGESTRSYHSTDGCRVGMFVLASPEFEQLHPHFAEALTTMRANSSATVGQEHIFHTLLGLFGIETPYYNPQLDICNRSMQPYSGPMPENRD